MTDALQKSITDSLDSSKLQVREKVNTHAHAQEWENLVVTRQLAPVTQIVAALVVIVKMKKPLITKLI